MKYQLLHLYGPFAIHSYGLFVALAIIAVFWLAQRDQRYKELNLDAQINGLLMVSVIALLVGARLVYLLTEKNHFSLIDFFSFWQGGLSVLGGTLGLLLGGTLYAYYQKIPVIKTADLAVIYIPLGQAIARIGCFFAGCCYGIASSLPWAVTYTDSDSMAPLCIPLHPTQLYSSFVFFSLFLLFYFVLRHKLTMPGQLLSCYLIAASSERFIIDFWRDDRIFTIFASKTISFHQFFALALGLFGVLLFFFFSYYRRANDRKA